MSKSFIRLFVTLWVVSSSILMFIIGTPSPNIGTPSPKEISLELSPRDLGEVFINTSTPVKVVVKNESAATLNKAQLIPSCSCTSVDALPEIVGPGESYESGVKITWSFLGQRSVDVAVSNGEVTAKASVIAKVVSRYSSEFSLENPLEELAEGRTVHLLFKCREAVTPIRVIVARVPPQMVNVKITEVTHSASGTNIEISINSDVKYEYDQAVSCEVWLHTDCIAEPTARAILLGD